MASFLDLPFDGADASQSAEDDGITVILEDGRGPPVELNTFKEYSFSSNFITPTDGFFFTLGDEAIKKSILDGIFVGQKVSLRIAGHTQAGGYVDRVHVTSSRRGGTQVTVTGRDWLSPSVDAHIDADMVRFSGSSSLADVLARCFATYGYPNVGQLVVDDSANRNIITGQKLGAQSSKKGKTLKSFSIHQTKPWPREGVYEFCARISQRFGLWIWPSADGKTLYVSEPDFTQPASYDIVHKNGDDGSTTGANNYFEASLDVDATNQPALIIASGMGGGGSQPRTGMKVAMANELLGLKVTVTGSSESQIVRVESRTDDDFNANFVTQILQLHQEATVLPTRDAFDSVRLVMDRAVPRVMFLHDDECKTPEQLGFYVRREMALKQQHAFVANVTFERHTLGGVPWCVNTIANVDDDALGLHNRMWVLERTFTKSRKEGTRTHVRLIPPYTLQFGES